MRRILTILGLVFVAAHASFGQTAIFVGDKGNAGIVYRGLTEHPKYDLKQCVAAAKAKCNKLGGTNCHLYYAGEDKGWWALIEGVNAAGTYACIAVRGGNTKEEVEKSVKKQYKDNGGKMEKTKITTWYVPPAAEKKPE
jgi:hypothetical protein